MTTGTAAHFGPRLIASATGTLRAALLAAPSASIENARTLPGEPAPVYTRAREAHAVLRKTLEYFGVECVVLDPVGDDPFDVSVCDAAVLFEDGALIMRPSAMSRRDETERIEAAFARIDIPIAGHIESPGLLDGGDVLLVARTAFVGVGARGNALGRRGFAAVAQAHGYRVVEVQLAAGAPMLRCVVSAVAKDTIAISGDCVDAHAFSGFKTIQLECGEALGAGVLCIGERHVIADVRYRTAPARLRKAGIAVEGIDLYDFEKIGLAPSMLALALKRD